MLRSRAPIKILDPHHHHFTGNVSSVKSREQSDSDPGAEGLQFFLLTGESMHISPRMITKYHLFCSRRKEKKVADSGEDGSSKPRNKSKLIRERKTRFKGIKRMAQIQQAHYENRQVGRVSKRTTNKSLYITRPSAGFETSMSMCIRHPRKEATHSLDTYIRDVVKAMYVEIQMDILVLSRQRNMSMDIASLEIEQDTNAFFNPQNYIVVAVTKALENLRHALIQIEKFSLQP